MLIADTIHKGRYGGCYTVLDACAKDASPEYSSGTRLPKWLLPNIPDIKRNKMRPDLLLIPTIPLTKTEQATPYNGPSDRSKHTVFVLEIGYTGDLRHDEKNEHKAKQHAKLASRLKASGWKMRYTPKEAITLGFGGTIRNDLTPHH